MFPGGEKQFKKSYLVRTFDKNVWHKTRKRISLKLLKPKKYVKERKIEHFHHWTMYVKIDVEDTKNKSGKCRKILVSIIVIIVVGVQGMWMRPVADGAGSVFRFAVDNARVLPVVLFTVRTITDEEWNQKQHDD